ncbi:MAG: hypothetical protein KGL68_03115 [Burkholderiales bacterium]|nr:hypothetical protein [Burkholderiales bacterium]
MPELVAPPRLINVDLSGMSKPAAAVIRLCALAPAPADHPVLGNAVHGAVQALNAVTSRIGTPAATLTAFIEDLNAAAAELPQDDSAVHQLLMAGLRTKYRVWDMLARLSPTSPTPVLLAAGAELSRCFVLEEVFRPGVAKQCGDFLASGDCGAGAYAYADRLISEVSLCAVAAQAPGGKEELLIATRILVSLAGQLTPRYEAARTAAGGLRQMTEAELTAAMLCLVDQVEAGNPQAVAVACAFFQGVAFDVALDLPFEHCVRGEWIGVQDVPGGLIKLDLTPVFPQLAKAKPGHVPASLILTRPYPQLLATQACKLVALNPTARCVRDLLVDKDISSRDPVPGLSTDAQVAPSIARLLESRGKAALLADIDRTLAAYTVADFRLIGTSKPSYTTVGRSEIWAAATKLFRHWGWGLPVENAECTGMAVGSMVTPTAATVQRIDAAHRESLSEKAVGKRYTQAGLLEHHNAYAIVSAERTALFTCARRANKFAFTADVYQVGVKFATLLDKRVGPLGGFTPIPLPRVLQEQISLWRSHLRALVARLKKLGWPAAHPVFKRCTAIERNDPVPLFFRITTQGIEDVGTADILHNLPEGILVNGDVFRHFMPNELRLLGASSDLIDAAMRHQIENTMRASGFASVVQLAGVGHVARMMDEIAVRLGFLPVQGLSRSQRNEV